MKEWTGTDARKVAPWQRKKTYKAPKITLIEKREQSAIGNLKLEGSETYELSMKSENRKTSMTTEMIFRNIQLWEFN